MGLSKVRKNLRLKKKFCEDMGIKPVIWIDDKPEWIVGAEAYIINR